MTNHVFRDIHRYELFPVVHGKSVTNKFGCDHRSPAPRLYDFFLPGLIEFVYLKLKLVVYVGPFF